MDLVVDFVFCAAHRLPRHAGRCHRMHGHSYKLQVVCSGTPDATSGMVIDFFDVEDKTGALIDRLDDSCLNLVLENPTAEAIVAWCWRELKPALPALSELRLWETDHCHVSYRGEPVPTGLLAPGSVEGATP